MERDWLLTMCQPFSALDPFHFLMILENYFYSFYKIDSHKRVDLWLYKADRNSPFRKLRNLG